MSADDLATRLERAWDDHATQTESVAHMLMAMAPGLPADADGGEAVRLAEHVWLAHLHDEAKLAAFLARLPEAMATSAASGPHVLRDRWVLAALAGSAAPEVPAATRWRAMHGLWSIWAARGRAADAAAMLAAELKVALADEDPAARRGLAASCNNLASDLREGSRGDAVRDALMLAAAQASKDLWSSAGTRLNVERADYLLARCHAALGLGAAALAHASACLAAIDAHADAPEADAAERFFAHEALAWAHLAAGEGAAARTQRARMDELRSALTDVGLAAWCSAALVELDAALT